MGDGEDGLFLVPGRQVNDGGRELAIVGAHASYRLQTSLPALRISEVYGGKGHVVWILSESRYGRGACGFGRLFREYAGRELGERVQTSCIDDFRRDLGRRAKQACDFSRFVPNGTVGERIVG